MKTLGLLLLLVAFLTFVGTFIWGLISEAGMVPWPFFLMGGAILLGTILLLAAAIRDRLKAKKEENFKGVDN